MRSSLRVYEHQLVRLGDPLASAGTADSFTQAHLDALARYNDEHGGSCFCIGYKSIKMTQFVGYVEVGDLSIEILPKADRNGGSASGERWRDALLEMLRVAYGLDLWTPSLATQQTTRATLMELVAARFVHEVEVLLHAGLARSYREEETNDSVMRGKLVFSQHIRENVARADRFYVRKVTFDRDIVVNQILQRTLEVIAVRLLSGSLPGRTRAALLALGDLSPVSVTSHTFDRVQLGRSTARYKNALLLARMILEQMSPNLRAGMAPVFALLFDMNQLWERYVLTMLRGTAGTEWRVSGQESLEFWRSTNGGARRVRPDIVVREAQTGKVRLVADTKWKVPSGGSPSDDDLKQMFVYNELMNCPRGVLIYPQAENASAQVGRFADRSHLCETFYEPVPQRGSRGVTSLEKLLAVPPTAQH